MPVYDLSSTYTDVTHGFISEARNTLNGSLRRIEHCLDQLSEEEIWHRARPEMNAIGNLVLHLTGNVTEWICDAAENQPSSRHRQSEFDQRVPVPKANLVAGLRAAVARADKAMAALATPALLLQHRSIRDHQTNLLSAIFHSVTHFEGHAQEIIAYTRLLRGERYQFLWAPKPAAKSQ